VLALIVSVQLASCLQLSQAQGRNGTQPRALLGARTAGSTSLSADPRGLCGSLRLPPVSRLGFRSPCDDGRYCSAETHRLWEDEVCSTSPGHRYIGMLTFPSRLR